MGDDIVTRLRSVKTSTAENCEELSLITEEAAAEIERLRAEVTAIRAERDCAQIQAAHLAQRLVAEAEARLQGGPP